MTDDLLAFASVFEHEGANDPRSVEHTRFVSSPYRLYDAFSADECLRITDLGRSSAPIAAGLAQPVENYRIGTAAQVELQAGSRWIFERLAGIFTIVNRWYRFEITGMREPPLYCEYPAGGVFGWHIDCGDGATASRKISLSLQLSDEQEYRGGGLEFALHGELVESRGLGSVVAFPAFIPHRVDAVTTGVRRALIAWAHGPPFR